VLGFQAEDNLKSKRLSWFAGAKRAGTTHAVHKDKIVSQV
jgi:hypothetical protein